MDMPITYFYEGLGDEKPPQLPPRQRMILEIARNFTLSKTRSIKRCSARWLAFSRGAERQRRSEHHDEHGVIG